MTHFFSDIPYFVDATTYTDEKDWEFTYFEDSSTSGVEE
jgi:hypothetical protein